jgi:hypothetical protein
MGWESLDCPGKTVSAPAIVEFVVSFSSVIVVTSQGYITIFISIIAYSKMRKATTSSHSVIA